MRRKKRRKIFKEGKYFQGGEGKGGKYLKKDNIFNEEKEREENIKRKNIFKEEEEKEENI